MSLDAVDLAGPLPTGRMLIEASAGTGKTYSIAALVARFVAGDIARPGHALLEGVDIAEVLVVTFTRAAASELRDRTRRMLRDAADHLDGSRAGDHWMSVFDGGSHQVRRRRQTRLREALARFDEATITTIHGFCQQALGQSGIRSAMDSGIELVEDASALVAEVARDVVLGRLIDDPLALSTTEGDKLLGPDGIGARPPEKVEKYILQTVRTVLANPGARREPDPGPGLEGDWAAVVDEVVREVAARQRARRQIGYDRLITDLRDLLADPATGPPLANQLASRYRLVLVDEFQDTDRVQWEVFDHAFGRQRLITVGDPKQAIYRFRGADVHAYLDAMRTAERCTLGTNYRSDRKLLDALGLLFNGATLGHPDIVFRRVAAAPDAPLNALGRGAALHIRVVPDDETVIPHNRDGPAAAAVQRVVLADVASRVRTLLDTATITDSDGTRRVCPDDIAVLVPSQRRAAEAAAVLREWGIPSVRARTGSVLDSEAAVQWRLLLAALVNPTRARVARAAGLGWFFDIEPAHLADDVTDEGVETPLAELQQRLAVHADRMRSAGVAACYEVLRAESRVLELVLARPNGDRNAADLDHIADLLTTETGGAPTDPVRVELLLELLMSGADDQAEVTMRRIESDRDAVQITTIHAAKGLEFPIVLLPFAYGDRPGNSRPYVYNDVAPGPDGDTRATRTIDVASWVPWSDDPATPGDKAMKARKARAAVEVDGDALRLLYVAMTRAKHRLELWWAPTKRAGTSAFGRLLYDRLGPGPVENTPIPAPFEKDMSRDVKMTWRQLRALVEASHGTIAVAEVPLHQPIRQPLPIEGVDAAEPRLADVTRGSLDDRSWRSWSFTAMTRSLDSPPAGGRDEPADAVDGEIPLSAVPSAVPPAEPGRAPPGAEVAMPLVDVVGGTTFGVVVHEVLERIDFRSPTLADDVREMAEAGVRRAGLALDVDRLTDGLVAAIDSPLGPCFGDGMSGPPTLRAIDARDRLAELTFDLEIAQPTGAVTPGSRGLAETAGAIGDVLSAGLASDDPLGSYGQQLAADLGSLSLAGWLNGSIDAVFRVDTGEGGGGRFVVVDYKSNRLHAPGDPDPLAAYHPDRLLAAMTHSHYPLQALLYSVALHRYLRWRLGERYDPERHLGGIAYLFVRGMVGAGTPVYDGHPSGVFSWRPPAATIVALDELFHGRRARSTAA